MNFWSTLVRLTSYLKTYRGRVGVVLALSATSTCFAVLSPKILGDAISNIFVSVVGTTGMSGQLPRNVRSLAESALVLVTLYVLCALSAYLRQIMVSSVAQRAVRDMRLTLTAKLSVLPMAFFDSRSHGDVMSRIMNDVDNIGNAIQQSIAQLSPALLSMIGAAIMMVTINPFLALASMVVVPFSIITMRWVTKRSRHLYVAQSSCVGDLIGHVEESYSANHVVVAFGRESTMVEQFDRLNLRLYKASREARFRSGVMKPLVSFLNNVGYAIVCVVGSVLVTKGMIRIGDVQAFIQYSRHFVTPFSQSADVVSSLQSALASAERIFAVLDEPEEAPDATDAAVLASARGNIRFDNVSFRYSANRPLIENMHIQVMQGQTIAIVGPTGAGKTTVANLIMRFYELSAGSITVDGVDVRSIRRDSLHRIIGMVLQDTWLFEGSVRDNIAYGRYGATEDEIVSAAVAAHADHFIRTLQDGYDTVLTNDAANVSLGEQQLLSLARVILARPDILILDEATSGVDSETEAIVQNAMTSLMEGATCIVIAHRLSTIRNADRIIVMDNGSVVESGTHIGLLKRGGLYSDLCNSKFESEQLTE